MVKTPKWPADRLKALIDRIREQTGLNQAQLAGLVGMNPSQLSRWTNGSSQPRYDSITALAEALRQRYPSLDAGMERELLFAAGYGGSVPDSQPTAAAARAPAPATAPATEPPEPQPTWPEVMATFERTMNAVAVAHQAMLERMESHEDKTAARFNSVEDRLTALEVTLAMPQGAEQRKKGA